MGDGGAGCGKFLMGEAGDSGGAEAEILDFRGPMLLRGILVFKGDGRLGDGESTPDWNMLLSSHPLSSA